MWQLLLYPLVGSIPLQQLPFDRIWWAYLSIYHRILECLWAIYLQDWYALEQGHKVHA